MTARDCFSLFSWRRANIAYALSPTESIPRPVSVNAVRQRRMDRSIPPKSICVVIGQRVSPPGNRRGRLLRWKRHGLETPTNDACDAAVFGSLRGAEPLPGRPRPCERCAFRARIHAHLAPSERWALAKEKGAVAPFVHCAASTLLSRSGSVMTWPLSMFLMVVMVMNFASSSMRIVASKCWGASLRDTTFSASPSCV